MFLYEALNPIIPRGKTVKIFVNASDGPNVYVTSFCLDASFTMTTHVF